MVIFKNFGNKTLEKQKEIMIIKSIQPYGHENKSQENSERSQQESSGQEYYDNFDEFFPNEVDK
jgi:hypothetical protein